jgi:hypothetical protein
METRTRHNCTKEGKFKFIHVALSKDDTDKIICIICGRVWQEVRDLKKEAIEI